jgi:valyl-tRNA synthetase
VALREARARHQVPPRNRLAARFQAEGDAANVLHAVSPLLSHMAGLSEVAIGGAVQRTADSATVVQGNSKAFLLGVVDLAKEKAKLEQQVEKLCAQIGGIEKKLGNEGFTAKAPPQVIQKERQNLEGLRQQLAGVEQSLRELG